jgi:hypothetical protein
MARARRLGLDRGRKMLALDAEPGPGGACDLHPDDARHLSGPALSQFHDRLWQEYGGDMPVTEDGEEPSINVEIETAAEESEDAMSWEDDDHSHHDDEDEERDVRRVGHETALRAVERYLRKTGHWNDETLAKVHRHLSRHRIAEEEGEAEDRRHRRRGRDNSLGLPSNATQALAGRINEQLPEPFSGAAVGKEPAAEPLLRRHAHDSADSAESFADFVRRQTDRVVPRGIEGGLATDAGAALERRARKPGPPSDFALEMTRRIGVA